MWFSRKIKRRALIKLPCTRMYLYTCILYVRAYRVKGLILVKGKNGNWITRACSFVPALCRGKICVMIYPLWLAAMGTRTSCETWCIIICITSANAQTDCYETYIHTRTHVNDCLLKCNWKSIRHTFICVR